ncbi:surface antigen [Clostridium tetanomorphum]|uniref:N-acetylmuramoyl-L-alanine amidase n=1 Tax=Clostridium tetanomorphum TaxID=1553 RepID=A0A923IZV0_CLOTT|nr:SH3 domain-containing protein [Clostridium tetanomorphum]KAJ51795.1 hypothetical protein CTM_11033 [Clostridium tetanomorphum DSM 665]MBC2397676.1 SH3 domain-containing protein [Clostridium tetanomorphum]MBP1865032.1 surface antigen/SH3-like domain-containing protein [Clostridium tetanomorphum]NRS83370.1 surface antigen [Clostridium tetanomorphum]NRZ96570.1 surface antigen [Clostridium tetanomorphum]
MNKFKKIILISFITTSFLYKPLCISVNAYNNSMPDTYNSAYNNDNIFTLSGYKGQCTWFTYGRILEKLNIKLPNTFYGNAIDWWYDNEKNNAFPYGSEPKENSIAVWEGGNLGYGHVAFVENVEENQVYFNEGNFSIRGDYDKELKCLSKENIKDRGNLHLKGYIYINKDTTIDDAIVNTKENSIENIKQTSSITSQLQYGNPKISATSYLNIRLNPSINSKICGSLKVSDKFLILSKVGDWYKIKFNSIYGYVSSQYVTIISKVSSTEKTTLKQTTNNINTVTKKNYAIVSLNSKNSRLNIRTLPSEKGKVIGSLNNGLKIHIIGNFGAWYKINYNGIVGYSSSQWLKIVK